MNKLINDQELRQSYAKKFKVSAASIASGTILYSNDQSSASSQIKGRL